MTDIYRSVVPTILRSRLILRTHVMLLSPSPILKGTMVVIRTTANANPLLCQDKTASEVQSERLCPSSVTAGRQEASACRRPSFVPSTFKTNG